MSMLTRRAAMRGLAGLALARSASAAGKCAVLAPAEFKRQVTYFNDMAPEDVATTIPNARAWEWMEANIPFLACPAADMERVYYYRWWAYRKHLRETPAGFIVTEFLRPVSHATDYNAISCALGHHVAEGRWLQDRRYIDQNLKFWLFSGPGGTLQRRLHQYSGWVAAACYDRWLVDGDTPFLKSLYPQLVADYRMWEQERQLPNGLYWQYDVSDGMEESISGGRRVRNARPTINSYMYGNARALSVIARLMGSPAAARDYRAKAERLRALVQKLLWNPADEFFETRTEADEPAGVRELHGYTPWYFDLPDSGRFDVAWAQILDPQGFQAPYGPTTAEQRHPGFKIATSGDDCQWNGPSWPFATTVALKAMANAVNAGRSSVVGRKDYFDVLQTYTKCHRLELPTGGVIPWVDENQNPFTGEWHARAMKIRKGRFNGRGDHYNHSAYADLMITGLMGLRPRADNTVEVNPLAPAEWDWFCLDRVLYHGHTLTILWDRTGKQFGRGQGLRVLAGGRLVAESAELRPVRGVLPPRSARSRTARS